MKERDLALKAAVKNKSASARNLFTTLRNKVVKNIRKAKADFFLTIIENAKGDSKAIWNLWDRTQKEKKIQKLW